MEIADRLKKKAWDNPISAFLARISNKMVFLIAIIGGLITAAFAMLIPISTLEAFTGASGLSEIIPATAAPLGSSARTLFVVFTAILAASILLVLLLSFRKAPQEDSVYSDDDYVNEMAKERNRMALSEDDSELAERIYQEDERNIQNQHQIDQDHIDQDHIDQDDDDVESKPADKKKFVAIAGGAMAAAAGGLVAAGSTIKSKIKKLPFMGGDDSIKSFDDLPKLRNADKHPDAPARRPLSADEDLGERILDKEWDQKDTDDNQSLDSNLSDIDELPAQENNVDQNEAEQSKDEVFLQPQIINEEIEEVIDETESLNDEEVEISISAENEDNIAADNNSDVMEPVAKEATSSHDDLPTIDSLMGRLEILVEKRAQRLQAKEESASETPADFDSSSEFDTLPETVAAADIKTDKIVKKETQLDDYADVIDDAAIKRAEKSAHDKKQAIDEDAIVDSKRPAATLVPASEQEETDTDNSDTDNSEADDGNTVVTKSQKAEMDNALKSALDTLHKMTERSA